MEISQFFMGVVTGAGVVAMGESFLLDQQSGITFFLPGTKMGENLNISVFSF